MKNAVKRIFFAKFRFDTAENEPAKNLQKMCKFLLILLILIPNRPGLARGRPPRLRGLPRHRRPGGRLGRRLRGHSHGRMPVERKNGTLLIIIFRDDASFSTISFLGYFLKQRSG